MDLKRNFVSAEQLRYADWLTSYRAAEAFFGDTLKP